MAAFRFARHAKMVDFRDVGARSQSVGLVVAPRCWPGRLARACRS
jgi:hypothetical protein